MNNLPGATILIRGAGFENKGAEAMACTVKAELGSRLPDASFLVQVDSREVDAALLAGFRPAFLPPIPGRRVHKAVRIAGAVLAEPRLAPDVLRKPWSILRLENDMHDITAVVDVSGFAYGDAVGDGQARETWMYLKHCTQRRLPYVLLPQAWGPFTAPALARVCTRICKTSSAFYARDDASKSHLGRLLGVDDDAISTAPDVAFRFQGADAAAGERLLTSLSMPAGELPIVGIVPNMRVYARMPGTGQDSEYVKLLVAACKTIRAAGAAVILMPHETALGRSSPTDDAPLCAMVKLALHDDNLVGMLSGTHTAACVKSVIANLDLLIGSRFHSIVAALSSLVPTVALGWTHKYTELMRQVGLGAYTVHCTEVAAPSFLAMVRDAYSNRAATREILRGRIPSLLHEVDATFDRIAAIVKSGTG